jgi:hypothetical protein
MTFLSFSLASGLLVVLHEILDSNFKLCTFVINELIKGEIEKLSGQFLGLIMMSHWLGELWIRIQDILVILPLSLFHVENHVCLSHGVQVAGAAWCATTSIVAGVGDLVQRTGDDRTGRVLGDRVIERLDGVVCGLHLSSGDEGRVFLGWASKTRSTVCQWFDLKTTGMVFFGLTLKPVVTVSLGLASKPVVLGFSVLASKLVAPVWWFGPQNQAGSDLSVAP